VLDAVEDLFNCGEDGVFNQALGLLDVALVRRIFSLTVKIFMNESI